MGIIEDYNIDEIAEGAIILDGLDDAIIGTSQRINEPVLAVYSWEKIIAILTERDNMDFEDAVEFVEFNILGAWVGENTPIVVMSLDW